MISWPPFPLWLDTPKGEATVLFVNDPGIESDLEWTCVHAGGEIWTWPNWDVRVAKNRTLGREGKPKEADDLKVVGYCTHGVPIVQECEQCKTPKRVVPEVFDKSKATPKGVGGADKVST